MSILPRSVKTHSRPRVNAVVAYIGCPLLLALSGYGLWRWLSIPQSAMMLEKEEIFLIVALIVVPVMFCIGLAVLAAKRVEYDQISASYQSRIDQIQKRLNVQEEFLHMLTETSAAAFTIFDNQNNYWFLNNKAAARLGTEVKDAIGKSPAKFLGMDGARKVLSRVDSVRKSGAAIEALDQGKDSAGKPRFVQSNYNPIAAFGDFSGGVTVQEQDITDFIVERERRENMFRQVIATLVAVIDRRDPFAAGHSQRVGQLSRAIAEEMVLSELEIEAAEVAGSLMNFGKVLVPREILTKATALTPEELQRVRDGILTSADILSIIDFVGPVVPTLRQVLERVDGSGAPKGLKGDDIMATARIVAAANTFVALASPRAHRPSMDFADAVQRMMKDADIVYDRRVLVALSNCIQNRADKLEWLRAKPLSA